MSTNTQNRRPNPLCGAYKDDPTFAKFQGAVLAACHQFDHPSIKEYILIRLWYTSKTFSAYWNERPTGDLNNRMIWILAHCYLKAEQAKIIMIAWMSLSFTVTKEIVADWESKKFASEWNRIQPHVKEALAKRNKRRRDKRGKSKMGRPKQTSDDSLGMRIRVEMKKHPVTAGMLTIILEANAKSIASHLERMNKAGEAIKVQRGLYELAGSRQTVLNPRDAVQVPVAELIAPVEIRPATAIFGNETGPPRIRSMRIVNDENRTAEPPPIRSMPFRQPRSVQNASSWMGSTMDAAELPTAEPRWSRR